jgi:hypothetical protein
MPTLAIGEATRCIETRLQGLNSEPDMYKLKFSPEPGIPSTSFSSLSNNGQPQHCRDQETDEVAE